METSSSAYSSMSLEEAAHAASEEIEEGSDFNEGGGDFGDTSRPTFDEELYFEDGPRLSFDGLFEDATQTSLDPPGDTSASLLCDGGEDEEANDDTIMSPSADELVSRMEHIQRAIGSIGLVAGFLDEQLDKQTAAILLRLLNMTSHVIERDPSADTDTLGHTEHEHDPSANTGVNTDANADLQNDVSSNGTFSCCEPCCLLLAFLNILSLFSFVTQNSVSR